jgi:hypothetical protein
MSNKLLKFSVYVPPPMTFYDEAMCTDGFKDFLRVAAPGLYKRNFVIRFTPTTLAWINDEKSGFEDEME